MLTPHVAWLRYIFCNTYIRIHRLAKSLLLILIIYTGMFTENCKGLNAYKSTKVSSTTRSVGLTWVGLWVWNTLLICSSGRGYSAFGFSSACRPHSRGAGAAGQGVSLAYGLRHPSSLGYSNRGVFCFLAYVVRFL